MRRFALLFPVAAWILSAQAVALAAPAVRMDITYTGGHIVSGPLAGDLTALPASVTASFLLDGSGPGDFELADVLSSSLAFGETSWNLSHLQSFSTTLTPTSRGGLAADSLTYQYAPVDTANIDGKIAGNFPLTIQGTDIATGQPFHYQYDTSSEAIVVVPEPSGVALSLIAAASVLALNRRHRKRSR